MCLMAQSHAAFPDGKASAKIVDYLSKKYKLGINTKPLRDEAEKFEAQIRDIINKAELYVPDGVRLIFWGIKPYLCQIQFMLKGSMYMNHVKKRPTGSQGT